LKESKNFVADMRKQESLSRKKRDANSRQDLYKQMIIARSNQKLAVRLFGLKPTYQTLKFEKDHNRSKERLKNMSRFIKSPFANKSTYSSSSSLPKLPKLHTKEPVNMVLLKSKLTK